MNGIKSDGWKTCLKQKYLKKTQAISNQFAGGQNDDDSFFVRTRSYAALRAADLDWIIGPGYNLGGYILEKNHENRPGAMKNNGKPTWNNQKNNQEP